MTKNSKNPFLILLMLAVMPLWLLAAPAWAEDMMDYPVVKLQSLDKATARTMTFEAKVGTTVKFGPLYIKVQACRKSSPLAQPESASFLQIWEVTKDEEAKWVFSGWMFASSPALSPMDHPIYDVWVIDCLKSKSDDEGVDEQADAEEIQDDTDSAAEESGEDESAEDE